jgi:hypothetical protein
MAQTNNDNKCLYLTFVVDRSGSMMSCGVAVFEGIRSCIEKKVKFAEKQDMSLCLTIFTFDDTIERLDIPSDPSKLTKEHYQIIKDGVEPRGWTRLYDTIHQAAIYTTELQEKQGNTNSRGFMVILTDGEDNQSDMTHKDLKTEIESHQKTGMEYIFIGANVNARNTGSALGISPDACMQFSPDPQLTQTAFSNLGMAIQRSIETDDGGFQFSQLERHTSCTVSDRKRFQVDVEPEPEPEPDTELPTVEEVLKNKRRTTWPSKQQNKRCTTWPSKQQNISDIFDTTYDSVDDVPLFSGGVPLFGDVPLFDGDIFAEKNNLFNLSFVDEEDEDEDELYENLEKVKEYMNGRETKDNDAADDE